MSKNTQAKIDTSEYVLVNSNYHEITGYTMEYSLLIQGYRTTEVISISITDSGKISFFSYNPCVFDDVDIKSIDEQALIKQLDRQVRGDYKDTLISYEIEMQRLAADENNKLIMEFAVIIEFSITYSDGEEDIFTQGIMYQIEV